MSAENAGLPRGLEDAVLAQLGVTPVDEDSVTGSITGVPSNALIRLGTGDKSVTGGTNDLYVYSKAGGSDTLVACAGILTTNEPIPGNNLRALHQISH